MVHHYRLAPYANLSYRAYHRDERDRIVAWQKSTDNIVNPMENGRGDHYRYDEEGQLASAWYETIDPANTYGNCQRQDHFGYDELGNRRDWNHVATRSWQYFPRKDNGLNQYRAWSPYSVINYDDDIGGTWGAPKAANGVLMQDGNITAGFNALNQPMYIWSGTSGWIHFGYDPLGRCVKRWTDGGAATYLYYDGWNLIQEGPQASNPSRLYIHGARVDELVAQITPANKALRYFHYDANGNCILQTDASGALVEQYSYDAFGYPYVYDRWGTNLGSSPSGNRFLFTGREWLSDLKLYDYRNRLYQPELGRFLQPDPKHFAAGDYNLYRYCHNDPVNNSDPTGMDAQLLPDGTYRFTMRQDLNPAFIRGTHVTNLNLNWTRECATGAQLLAGTRIRNQVYDVPATRTWTRGPAVGSDTPIGTVIARGWDRNGRYQSLSQEETPRGQLPNHTGIYVGPGQRPGTIRVLDQYDHDRGTLNYRDYSTKEGWSEVRAPRDRDRNPSTSAIRARPR